MMGRTSLLIVAIVLTSVSTTAPPALADDHNDGCYGGVRLGCNGGNPGDPGSPGDGNISNPYWGAPVVRGLCDWSESALLIYTLYMPDGTPALPGEVDISLYPGARVSNNRIIKTECVVIDLTPGRAAIEDVVVAETAATGVPTLSTSPIAAGATGLDTWLWYDGTTEIGPVNVAWTEPLSGIVFQLEGRGWLHQVSWAMGDGADVHSPIAEEWLTSSGVVGSGTDPAAIHLYEQTPEDFGIGGDTYPITTTVTWEGEWRYAVGGVWSAWDAFPGTWTTSTTTPYQVVEIIPVLTG